ncbi:LysR family transcriptional regulator [Janibacter cremeus]|uniref:LysR family transcriptional regulator n=1 Tax=Janibacter cremeus TaxID=1285192 RepID=UPI0023F6C191|nr:LysR family transcriptional regulator [Janibacter cremeus]WEV76888.1 LysR family transcriptional regulator [Janibacter cremeus]
MLNPVHLRTLHTVLRTGSFADAARELGYSGSAVSQQITALERQIHMRLFERDGHGVRATPTAHFISERSLDALGRLQSLEDDITLLRQGSTGRLRLGSFPTASERILPMALSRFRHEQPDIEVRLDEGEEPELTPMLVARELDVAIMYRYGLVPGRYPRGFRALKLLVEDLLVLVPADHPLLGGSSGISIDQLESETWIAPRLGTPGAAMLRRLSANAGFSPEVAYRTNNYATTGGLVRAKMGIAVVPALGFAPLDGVVPLRLSDHGAHRVVMAVRAPATSEGSWRGLVDALREASAAVTEEAIGVSLPER